MIKQGKMSKVEARNFTVFICQHEATSCCFDHSDLEIMEMIFRRLDTIDIDLIYGIFQALEGKYLTPESWQNLVEVVKRFDPDPGDELP